MDEKLQSRLWAFPFAISAVVLPIVLLWLPFSNIEIAPGVFEGFTLLFALTAALAAYCAYVTHRVAAEKTLIGKVFFAFFSRLGALSLVMAGMIPTIVSLGMLTYLVSARAGPLLDAELAALDASLGFDWVAFLAWTNQYPDFVRILEAAYYSASWQLAAVPVFLAIMGRKDALFEFAALVVLTSLITSLVAFIVPAIGPFGHFNPPAELFDAHTQNGGSVHREHFDALRAGHHLVISGGAGLITFPSYHTVLALVLTYAVRHSLFALIPIGALNALMIVSTLPVGGHYLADLFAGGAVTLASIMAINLFANAPRRDAVASMETAAISSS